MNGKQKLTPAEIRREWDRIIPTIDANTLEKIRELSRFDAIDSTDEECDKWLEDYHTLTPDEEFIYEILWKYPSGQWLPRLAVAIDRARGQSSLF